MEKIEINRIVFYSGNSPFISKIKNGGLSNLNNLSQTSIQYNNQTANNYMKNNYQLNSIESSKNNEDTCSEKNHNQKISGILL